MGVKLCPSCEGNGHEIPTEILFKREEQKQRPESKSSKPRQIVVIMFTDIVGYTEMMGRDENLACENVSRHNEFVKQFVADFNGRIDKYIGYGILCKFLSASEAISAAKKIQYSKHSISNSKSCKKRMYLHL